MSSHFPIDDPLDDADLWSLIDTAAASSHLRKTNGGEVVNRPHKLPRFSTPDSRMLVLRNQARAPLPSSSNTPRFSSPAQNRMVVESPGQSSVMMTPHSLAGGFPSVSMFKNYQNAAMAILEKTDYTMIHGNPFIKKSGWRKISFFFNLSFEIKDKSIEFDENRNVQRAEFVVRAYMQGGRFSDGWGSCDCREKRFSKANHDIPSTAETRAKNKACQDLLGIGEYRPGVKLWDGGNA